MTLVRLTNGGFRYPSSQKCVFRGLKVEIERGEVIRVTGRNGSGKSTLLKVLSGLLPLSEGELWADGKTRVAYMDQFAGEMLARELTIQEQFKAVSSKDASPNLAPLPILNEFGLGLQDRLNAFVGHLSGGERQIIALLSTLAAGAKILCLDEFASALDARSTEIAEQLLIRANTTAGIALLIVSHAGSAIHTHRNLEMS